VRVELSVRVEPPGRVELPARVEVSGLLAAFFFELDRARARLVRCPHDATVRSGVVAQVSAEPIAAARAKDPRRALVR